MGEQGNRREERSEADEEPHGPNIPSLATELQEKIFSHCDAFSVEALRATCKHLRAIGERYRFDEVHFAWHERSVNKFLRITNHPVRSKKIKRVVLHADVLRPLQDVKDMFCLDYEDVDHFLKMRYVKGELERALDPYAKAEFEEVRDIVFTAAQLRGFDLRQEIDRGREHQYREGWGAPSYTDHNWRVFRAIAQLKNLEEVIVMVTEGEAEIAHWLNYAPKCRHPFWRDLYDAVPAKLYFWSWPPRGLHQVLELVHGFMLLNWYPKRLRIECRSLRSWAQNWSDAHERGLWCLNLQRLNALAPAFARITRFDVRFMAFPESSICGDWLPMWRNPGNVEELRLNEFLKQPGNLRSLSIEIASNVGLHAVFQGVTLPFLQSLTLAGKASMAELSMWIRSSVPLLQKLNVVKLKERDLKTDGLMRLGWENVTKVVYGRKQAKTMKIEAMKMACYEKFEDLILLYALWYPREKGQESANSSTGPSWQEEKDYVVLEW
ncbi:uncharacterized protein BDZ99DRAFT_533716 [Mytilinidion resinicola]|uniref:F-box domain-containing protein n=1 Tax=Mytilinidion resinicola TaxID=574789 RepID=A0A6A6YKR9_9PEZI|nr:uncharacterized protein BDZ99DRAFT_533716 [Mytilinidion resinicola]KAF2809149.1 hypothetical protein BDZ99DRAFT_533716 [Mytilinidion resinicola]